ncbi:citramalate synthase [Aestuariivirga litoralis]|uniref:citramalate synthase n=1 Tax=Aestuariivirga litoralis TaxID=2650924 RepID=UPI0018C73FB2|nr:citramalate synthase [Aestuariivirga litoralis]MBG1232080.1 citramalate synthase [Aestuariivirga litoralis]
MTRRKITLFDTTLRDGQQTPGVSFSLEDKLAVMALLDRLGVDYIEGGYPGGNPTDTALFAEERKCKATFTAFGMTKRAGRSVSNDAGLQTLLQAKAKAICFVGKSWDYQVRVALGCTNEENLESITDSVKAAKDAGKEVLVDCEHFFDGYKANPEYALACAKAAYDAGARWVVLCETNGGSMPHEVREIVTAVAKVIPGSHLGVHAHNDTEQAVANSLAAVEAGVCQIQGTLNGIGERCGNANLISIIGTLGLKPHYAKQFEISAKVSELTTISRAFDELLNRAPNAQAPYVGKSAFATKAGIHASALAKDPETYEHVKPESVGNRRAILVSDQAGKSNLIAELERIGLAVKKDDTRLDHLLREVKEREAIGYAYDGADASFELLARRTLGSLPHYFDVLSFQVNVGLRDGNMYSEASVKVKVGDEVMISAGEGNGPVSALDVALRKDLGKYQKHIEDMGLVDFKVRILNGSTSAITRVMIESKDSTGRRWFTVGVSPNIVEASFQALLDAMVFKLLQEGVAA